MGVRKEFFCPGHGSFESDAPRCPHGCTIPPEREFRTAPAYHSGRTARTDSLIRSQVDAMGLGNIKTNMREGDTARITSPAMRKQMDFQASILAKYPSNWGALPAGGTLNVKTGEIEHADRGKGAVAALGTHHAEAADVVAAAGLRGAKHAYEAVRDPQNLSLDVGKAA